MSDKVPVSGRGVSLKSDKNYASASSCLLLRVSARSGRNVEVVKFVQLMSPAAT